MSPTPNVAGLSHQTIVTDANVALASRDDVQDLADKVVGLQAAIEHHDGHAQSLVAQALQTMLSELPAALEAATERAMRRVATDQALHQQIGASVLQQAAGNMHKKVGRFVFSKWFAIGALVIVVANAIGWPATIKALLALFKGGAT